MRLSLLKALFLVCLISIAAPLAAQNSRFVVFIHQGGGSADLAQKVALELGRKGYVVRKPDSQRDTVAGAGVDYFNSQDASGATDVANAVNAVLQLPDARKLRPRMQRAKNPPGYLAVWLF